MAPYFIPLFSRMQKLPLLSLFTYITSSLSGVHAFSVTIGTPTQCDDLVVSWIGGQAPFEILVTPVYQPLYNISVPSSAFRGGEGSYSIPQLPLTNGIQFFLTMSDATGFGSGGTSTVLTVGAPIANNNCNTTVPSPDFYFSPSSSLQQCSDFIFTGYGGAIQPAEITGLIPGGGNFVLYPVTNSSYTWVVDVKEGTSLIFFMTDSQGRQSGTSALLKVADSTDASCLDMNSPSSTASAPSQTSASTSSGSNTSTANVGIVIGIVATIASFLIVLSWLRKRKARSSNVAVATVTPVAYVTTWWYR
ncbi:hypothetical protein M405DRAFT_936387 [Rhizopogon salebrosus TDB-379]|nr:hypothetical protein M405DRAFT_936387 [Rhizopogon salebrosus TDB-379]